MEAVSILKVEKKLQVFKAGEPANAIEVIRLCDESGDSLEFNIIAGKDLNEVGDYGIYIMPDYTLPERNEFMEYLEPGGDPSKCKLGKGNRIKAIKFNFSFEREMDPIYSNGIFINLKFLPEFDHNQNLQEFFGITKYVAADNAESMKSGLTKGDLPDFLYATDETRIETIKKHVNMVFDEDEEIAFTLKRDGSSITNFCKIEPEGQRVGVCSRNQEKKLEQEMTTNYIDTDGVQLHRYINRTENGNIRGWFNDSSQKFYTKEEVEALGLKPIIVEIRDSFVDTTKKHGYLDKLTKYCEDNKVQLAIRGELIGGSGGSKGSGNKLNQDCKGDSKVVWFGVDDLSLGKATRIHYGLPHNLKDVCETLDLEYTKPVYIGKLDYDGIIKKGNEIFAEYKKNNHILEGIVIRTTKSNRLSCKYLNPDYDSRK